jgi:hypothetical protein
VPAFDEVGQLGVQVGEEAPHVMEANAGVRAKSAGGRWPSSGNPAIGKSPINGL